MFTTVITTASFALRLQLKHGDVLMSGPFSRNTIYDDVFATSPSHQRDGTHDFTTRFAVTSIKKRKSVSLIFPSYLQYAVCGWLLAFSVSVFTERKKQHHIKKPDT
jgi:hypothetical protein